MAKYSETAYDLKLEAIFSRFPSVQKVPFGEGYKPGLAHMLDFARALGNPHEKFRTIHVAGTNGKGSVSSMLASALSACGLKTGLYTSPHIEDFRERARILPPVPELVEGPVVRQAHQPTSPVPEPVEGVEGPPCLVPREYVFDFLCRHESEMEALDLSFFEITTGLAFTWFADEEVDVAVIEVGLGGRLDSTNIITPDLSVITSIALDHCAMLGDTLAAIAREKAGIFKQGVPTLVGEYLPETRPVFEDAARRVGAPLTFAQDVISPVPSLPSPVPELVEGGEGVEGPVVRQAHQPSSPVPELVEGVEWTERQMNAILSRMDLQGKYQAKNLRTVLAALDILKKNPYYSGLEDEAKVVDAIERTARRAGFHGRWQRLSEDPVVIADIGHNPAALKENFSQLEGMKERGECSGLVIVYAIMADKDLDGIMPLMPQDATYVFTNPQTRRSLPGEELFRRYRGFRKAAGLPEGRIILSPSVHEALGTALEIAKEESSLVYVGGSTYLVSEAVRFLKEE